MKRLQVPLAAIRHRSLVLRVRLLPLVVAASLCAGVAAAAVLHVRPDGHGAPPFATWRNAAPTIQTAMAAAAAGDTVLVGLGRYEKTVTLKSGVALMSASGADSTILDAAGDRYVLFGQQLDASTLIQGFTLQHGRRDHPNSGGGGIYLEGSSPLVVFNIIQDHLGYLGPCVYMNHGSNAVIACNVMRRAEGYLGGAVAAYARCAPLVYNNLIVDNDAVSGGAVLAHVSTPVIIGNTMIGNAATSSGGGIYLDDSPALIRDNVIARSRKGAAVYLLGEQKPAVLHRNLVWQNEGGAAGGACKPPAIEVDGNCEADPGALTSQDGLQPLLVRSPCDSLPVGAAPWSALARRSGAARAAVPDSVRALWQGWLKDHGITP
jgi:hypothetical protein